MKIGYISDLHINTYIPKLFKTYKDYIEHFLISPFDYLIVAGDISEDEEQLIDFFQELSKYYKGIFFVPGNHDLYQKGRNKNIQNKYDYLKENINKIENVFFLDGEILKIGEHTISGLGMFYDNSYLKHKYPMLNPIQIKDIFSLKWNSYMRDSLYMTEIDIEIFFQNQMNKLKRIKNVDILVSHVKPVYFENFINEKFKGIDSNTFFSFDGLKILKNNNIKNWVFGHVHNSMEDKIFETNLLCNPLGYPNENDKVFIKELVFPKKGTI